MARAYRFSAKYRVPSSYKASAVGSGLAADPGHGMEEQPVDQVIRNRTIRVEMMALIRTQPNGFFFDNTRHGHIESRNNRYLLPLTYRLYLTRIPQLNRKCRKRGAILEQRRRPTVKFQSHFALSHAVAMRLDIPSKHR